MSAVKTWNSDMMRLGFLVVASAALLAIPALAAEPVYDWTGFYIGANAGGGWGHAGSNVVLDAPIHHGIVEEPVGSSSGPMNGVLGGVQSGYNYQIRPFVFGLESDIQATVQKGDGSFQDTISVPQVCIAPCVPPPPLIKSGNLDYTQKLPWFGTLRGRVGVTPAEHWLVFATGGLAFGAVDSGQTFTLPTAAVCVGPCPPAPSGSASGSSSQIKTGWALGGGVEAAIGGGWTGKIEYLHVDLGKVSNSFVSEVPYFSGTFRTSGRVTDDIVRIGVNYRFGAN